MASFVARFSHCVNHGINRVTPALVVPVRTMVFHDSGAIIEKPSHVKFGIAKLFLMVFPFLTFGGFISREFATLLEEHELFVPDDDGED